jgi:hypothetical protein
MQYLGNGETDNLVFIDNIMVKLMSNNKKKNFDFGSNCYQKRMVDSKSALMGPILHQRNNRYSLILRKTTKFSSIFMILIRFEHKSGNNMKP